MVDIYNTSTDTWSTAQLSQKRGNINALTVGDKIYFAGGLRSVSSGLLSPIVDIYDHSTQSWTTDTLSQGRRFIGIAQANHKLLFAGGERTFSGNNPTTRVDVYDLITETWSIDELPNPHDAYSVAQLPGKAFFISGGRYSNNTVWNTMDIYTPFGLGTAQENGKSLKVYPNPSIGLLKVSSLSRIKQVQVYSLSGRLLLEFMPNSKIWDGELGLSSGTYLLHVQTESGTEQVQVVLQ